MDFFAEGLKNRISISLKVWKILFIVSVVISLFTLVYNKSSNLVSNLALLPFAYAIFLLFARKTFRKQPGLALIIINVVMVCRFLITPVLYAFTADYSGIIVIGANLNQAVWCMVYEVITVGIAMFCWSSVKHKDKIIELNVYEEKKIIRPLTVVIIIFWFFIILANSKLRGCLFNFSLLSRVEMGINTYMTVSEYYADIPGAYKIFFYLGMIVILASLVSLIAKIKMYKGAKIFFLVIISIGFISSMWTSGFTVSRWNMLIAVIITSYVLIYVFPKYKKAVLIIGVVGVLLVVVVGSVLKIISFGQQNVTISDATNKYLTAEYFDEYFSGIAPVANGLKTTEFYKDERGINGIFIDCFFNFPYAMKILYLSDGKTATYYFQNLVGRRDFVVPVVTQSMMQFGIIFAPLYSCLLVCLALWCDRKQQAATTLYKKLFYTVIVFWLSLFMAVSTNVIEANIWYAVIGIWLMTTEEKLKFSFGSQSRIVQRKGGILG